MYAKENDKSGDMPIPLFRHIRGTHAFSGGLLWKTT
jgi:hypothetical protein